MDEKKPNYNEKLGIAIKYFVWLFVGLVMVLVSLLVYDFEKYQDKNSTQLIELIKSMLSWPVLGSLAALIFISRFPEQIGTFLTNNKFKPNFSEENKQPLPTDTYAGKKERAEKELKEENNIIGKNVNELEKQLETQKKISEINEFAYLALFFIDTTKRVLKWFYDLNGKSIITQESFNMAWQAFILDPNQRIIIFNILQQNGMIQGVAGGAFSITKKGEDFLKYIGFIS